VRTPRPLAFSGNTWRSEKALGGSSGTAETSGLSAHGNASARIEADVHGVVVSSPGAEEQTDTASSESDAAGDGGAVVALLRRFSLRSFRQRGLGLKLPSGLSSVCVATVANSRARRAPSSPRIAARSSRHAAARRARALCFKAICPSPTGVIDKHVSAPIVEFKQEPWLLPRALSLSQNG